MNNKNQQNKQAKVLFVRLILVIVALTLPLSY